MTSPALQPRHLIEVLDRHRVEYVLIGGYFMFDRPGFVAHAHVAAAISLFAGLILVALASDFAYGDAKAAGQAEAAGPNPYAFLAGLLMATAAGILGTRFVIDEHWTHWLFWLEAAVIAEFIAYWIVQSKYQWNIATPGELIPDTPTPP